MRKNPFEGMPSLRVDVQPRSVCGFLVILIITLLVGGALAETQVDNTYHEECGTFIIWDEEIWIAGSFTTGDDTYDLNSISTMIKNNDWSLSVALSLALYSDNAGEPGSLIGQIGVSDGIPPQTGGLYAVTSSGGIVLQPATTYWVVYSSFSDTKSLVPTLTIEAAESSPSGWTIGDDLRRSETQGASWELWNYVPRFLVDASVQTYAGENLIAAYAGTSIGTELDGVDVETSLETVDEDDEVTVYFFLTNPTAAGDFDPTTGLSEVEFCIEVDGDAMDCSFTTPDPAHNNSLMGSILSVCFTFSTALTPHVDYGNHILIGQMTCTIPEPSDTVTLKIVPYAGTSQTCPAVYDLSGDKFECGTSVGGCASSGYDTVAFIINPDGAEPVGDTRTTWSCVKTVYK